MGVTMDIKIGKYLIGSDYNQFILYEIGERGEKSKNPGEERKTIIGHYPTLKCCLECFPDRALMLSNAEGIEQVLDELKSYKAMIGDALREG
jgi:hypothetical protein